MAKKLNEQHYAAIAILATPKRSGLTYKQVAETVGIAESTLHEWRKLDEFNEAVKTQVLRNAVEHLPDMFASIPKHVIEDGNAALFRTYIQSLGMLTDRVDISTSGSGNDMDAMKAEIARMKANDSDKA